VEWTAGEIEAERSGDLGARVAARSAAGSLTINDDRQDVPLPASEVTMSRVTIKELRLRNYRAFADARLVLDDVTFLVGRNGAGKSTLMDAFAFVSEAVTDSLGTALERRGGPESIRRRRLDSEATSGISVAVGFQLEHHRRSIPVIYGFTLGKERATHGAIIKREVLQSTDEWAVWGESLARFNRTHNEFRCARLDLHPVLDAETLVFPLIAGASEPWKLIAEALRRISFHQLSPQAIRIEPQIGSELRLSRDGHNAGDILKQLKPADRHWIDERLAATISGLRAVRATARAGRRVIVFEQESNGDQVGKFEASMMSDGTLRSLGILLALRQSPRPSIVLIDEIEDSLHWLAHGALLDALDAASEEFPLVVSTHNPEILSHPTARGERIRVIQWDKGKSGIYRLSDNVKADLEPPLTVGQLLRANALWTDDEPSTTGAEDDFFKP
jgi:predicted ATPase